MKQKKQKIRFGAKHSAHRNAGELHYILFNKPYGVLSQFTSEGGREGLLAYGPFPKDVYPVGRLDADSEGLLLLTNDGKLKHLLIEPKFRHPRTYAVQVEGIPDDNALNLIRKGVLIEGKETLPAEVRMLTEEPKLPPRAVPIRYRKSIPTSWIELTLYEGRNRQVRKMTAAVGYPTLRLIRVGIGPVTLGDLKPGEHRKLTTKEAEELWQVVQRSSYRL